MNRLWNMIRYGLFATKEERMFGEWYKSLKESAIEWNVTTLTDNNLTMQIRKVLEEIGEVLEAVETNPKNKVNELADVLISIWGLSAFDYKLANIAEQAFILLNDKGLKEILVAANDKINELYKREYEMVDGVYRHKEKTTTIN